MCVVLLLSCQDRQAAKKDFPIITEDILAQIGAADNFRQPANSTFDYYAQILPNSILLAASASAADLTGAVEISADDGVRRTFSLDRDAQLDLSEFAGKTVKFSFQAVPPAVKQEASTDAALTWQTLRLQTVAPLVEQTPPPAPAALDGYDVVYIVLDAFHAAHASVYGYPKNTTPFLAEFAQEAVVFDKMFANAPYTLASTGVLFTSKYAHETGLINTNNALPPIVPTISELLTEAGVETYLLTHHGYLIGDWGLARGFGKIFNKDFGSDPSRIGEAIRDIYGAHTGKRKFLYFHLLPPHHPYLPPEKFRTFVIDRPTDGFDPNENLPKIDAGDMAVTPAQLDYIRSWYDSNILFADHLAQLVVEALQAEGVLEKTIVIISSDHGEAFYQHGRMMHGTTVFDEMLHVPFLMRFPQAANIPPHRVAGLASLVDVTPTLAELYGLAPADFSGHSLLPVMRGDQPAATAVYAEALVYEDLRAIRDQHYKYIASANGAQLFDLTTDPGEQQNLAEQQPIRAGYYQQRLQARSARSGANVSASSVDLQNQRPDVLQNLRDLGYIQ